MLKIVANNTITQIPFTQSIQQDLIGKLAMLHPLAHIIEEAKRENFDIGYCPYRVEDMRQWQLVKPNYRLIFIKEPAEWLANDWQYCLAEIGDGYTLKSTNWHWFTLSQLIVCV